MGAGLAAALSDPWAVLSAAVDGPLHPGGEAATAALLDRAGVGPETRLLDVGCGAGGAVELARGRGAAAVGLDRDPGAATAGGPADRPDGAVRGDLTALPVADGAVDVVLAECSLCLADDVDAALAEARRVLAPGGRLALSDVVTGGSLDVVAGAGSEGSEAELPAELARALCLTGDRDRGRFRERVERAGFAVRSVVDHQEAVVAMRDEVLDAVEYEALLGSLGERGERWLAGVEALSAAVDDGRVGYVSLVADRAG